MEAIFTPIFTFAVLAASLAICVAMAEKLFRRRDIVISGFAVIVSRCEIVVSHHEMTLDVISGMIGALGGVAPAPSAPTVTVGRGAEAATHGVAVPTDIASMVGNGKMYAAVCKKPAKRNVVCVENTTFVSGNQIT